MIRLLRSTNAYEAIGEDARRGTSSHAMLVVFPDEGCLRALLTECAKAFFSAEDGSRAARLIGEEHFPDCRFFPAAGEKLTADAGASILDASLLRPVEEQKKLFVLDAFHTVVPLVQNKLLKVLEEPPAGVYFLLGASNVHAVLPTVRSRMKTFEVPPFSEERIFEALTRTYGEREGAREAAAACGGVYSVAEKLLTGGSGEFLLAEKFLLGENVEALCRALTEAEKPVFFAAVRLVLRDALLLSQNKGEFAARRSEGVKKIARELPAGALLKGLSLVEEAERQIKFNANFAQCALALAICLKEEKKKWQTLS